MPWIYSQNSGTLSQDGRIAARGYSGLGEGKNKASMQAVKDVGPIPEGEYIIGPPRHSARVGPYAMPLTPNSGTQTFGRDAFFMHGDSLSTPGTASTGCIIMDRVTRERVWASGDRRLRVIR